MSLLSIITPLNLEEEKVKFFSDSNYHPQFSYDWGKGKYDEWLENNNHYESLMRAIFQQEGSQITSEAEKIFQTTITDEYLQRAKENIKIAPQKLTQPSNELVAHEFQKAFKQLGLVEYSLEIVFKDGFNFRPSPSNKKIYMSQSMNAEFYSVDAEIKHELAHIIRYENGKHNKIKRDGDYLPTEEGLASYCQDYTGEYGTTSLFQRSAEYVATLIGMTASLRDVFNFMIEIGFSKELAWQRATRHKYGFQNTQMQGDIMKPAMYFYQQQKIKELSSDEKYRLFMGKISSASLEKYPEYKGRVPLNVLKTFYAWS